MGAVECFQLARTSAKMSGMLTRAMVRWLNSAGSGFWHCGLLQMTAMNGYLAVGNWRSL